MSQHRPGLVPAIFALLSLAAPCAVSARAVHAAPCITKPNAPAPQGEHWYYRTDRATGRQCWYLGAEDGNNRRSATQASDRSASDPPVQPAGPQPAQRETVAQAPAGAETNGPAMTEPPPRPEATQLPYMPPVFLVPPTPAPAPAEQPQTSEASDAANEPESPAVAQASSLPASPQSTEDANHTLTLAMIAFLTIAILGAAWEITRWLRRRKSSYRLEPDWTIPDTFFRDLLASSGSDSARPPPPTPPLRSFAEAEKLAEDLQKILDELRTRPSFSMHEAGDLTRSPEAGFHRSGT